MAYTSTALNTTSTYAMEATDVSDNQATLTYTVEGVTVEHRLGCRNGALSEMSYLDLGSAMTGRVQATTRNVEGVLLPENLQVGSTWRNSFDITMTGTGASNAINMDATMSAERKVVGEEQVTVGAGTFTALKIQGRTKMHFATLITADQRMPDVILETTEWWVRGKGLVKTETRSGSFGSGFSSEATSIVTP